ncbi:MAG TPA: leucyl aminopeptidase [Rheinheimera sp.]|uniref:leucyl aminopeptidase n=1 Tax=Rheinheimera sp. TaxID=1869214 RepID=UPI000EB957BB|nr:leucyl aminopeptidase [Rheinheimera sp.]HCU65061.1 leucyl aminopeptidase [Rheinheimera sp.]
MKLTRLSASAFAVGCALLSSQTLASLQFNFSDNTPAEVQSQLLLVSEQSLSQNEHPQLQDALAKAWLSSEKFTGKKGAQLELRLGNAPTQRLVLLGLGDSSKLSHSDILTLGADAAAVLAKNDSNTASIDTSALTQSSADAAKVATFAQGLELRSYRFDKYKSKNSKTALSQVHLLAEHPTQSKVALDKAQALNSGVFLARDLTNEPAEALTPQTFADAALELEKLGVKVQVLDEKALQKAGLGALYAVGKGSNRPPRLVIAQWQNSNKAPLAIIGKGITFDTGGYHLKTDGESIVRMTSDMAGAAAALGTIKTLALQKAPVNVVAVMAMAENMISDKAMLPGDIIKTGAGLTVQITSTDAEGRLVMADALWYANQQFKPRAMVDIATLTGSKVGALGSYYAGLFSEDEQLVQQLTSAGAKVNEPLWRLPLGPQFASEMKSDLADLRNTGKTTGASTAAWFLQQFVGQTPWAHIDIAGNALASSDKGVQVTGATGFGVQLLTEWALTQP